MKDIQKFVRKGNLDLKVYIPGKSIEEVQEELGLTEIAKLASNETPLGPSPKAVLAAKKELRNAHLYPEGRCTLLIREMSKKLGIEEEMITFSNGADNCILLIASAFINEGDEIVMGDPSFFVFQTVTKIMGGKPIFVKLKNHIHDLNAMRERVGKNTKLVFVCNPNNPTGTIVKKAELDKFISQLPDFTILILDEAYFEFASDKDYPDGLDYIKQGYNVISLRTFSKIYGIAGLRIGYALGRPEFIAALNRVREPFPVSRVAQVAALAALDDEDYRERVLRNNEEGKAYLYNEFQKLDLPYAPSQTNFVFVDLKNDCERVFQDLLKKGIIIRPGNLWNYHTFVRISVGTMEQNRRAIEALKGCLL
jgi:histidinol-phosphate aminotransferase